MERVFNTTSIYQRVEKNEREYMVLPAENGPLASTQKDHPLSNCRMNLTPVFLGKLTLRKFQFIGCCLLLFGLVEATLAQEQGPNTLKKGLLLDAPKTRLLSGRDKFSDRVIFEEGFKNADQWSKSGTWETGIIAGSQKGAYSSLSCAATNLSGNYGNNANDWLISPTISLRNTIPRARLILDLSEMFELESGHDHGYVKVSLDNGSSWIILSVRDGKSVWRQTQIDITSYAENAIKLAFHLTSDNNLSYAGWNISDVKITELLADPLTATMTSLNSQDFPFIYTNVAVDTFGVGLPDLTRSNFIVHENGLLQTEFFDVTPPEIGGGVRLADIVFVIDVTGSMAEEIEAVRLNMLSFVNALSSSDIDYRIGFVVFGDVVFTYNDGNLYSEQSEVLAIINSVQLGEHGIGSGGDEPENQLEAMAKAATMNYRPGTQKVQILLTDATAHEADVVTPRTVASLTSLLTSTAITVFPVFDTNVGKQQSQYIPIAQATNGRGTHYHIFDNFNPIINDIGLIIANSYRVRYKSSNPVCDGSVRNVEVQVAYAGNAAITTSSYIPCAAPSIQRTTATINLSSTAQIAGVPLTIAAEITDSAAPFVQSATLFYRATGTSNFTAIAMSHTGGNIYQAIIPGSSVAAPGLDYYITATDGQTTSSDPGVDPASLPYQIAVLPNQAPQITHTPITSGTVGAEIVISTTAVDNTNFLTTVELQYRQIGTLIFNVVTMTSVGGNQYEAAIPGSVVTEDGVEYFIRAVDNFGLASIHGLHSIATIDCIPAYLDDFSDGNADEWLPNESTRWATEAVNSDLAYCLRNASDEGDEYSLLPQNWTDFELKLQARATDLRSFFIIFGVQALTNSTGISYYLRCNTTGVDLFRSLEPGQGVIIASATNDLASDGQFHNLSITRRFPDIAVHADGQLLFEVQDATFPSGFIGVGAFKTRACFDDIAIISLDCETAKVATLSISSGLRVPFGSNITIPIFVSTTETIGLAQFTIEYDNNDLQFDHAAIGADASNFTLTQEIVDLPFPPTTIGTNDNVLVQISGGGTNSFSGNGKTVVLLTFTAVGNVDETTPLAFDIDCTHTFLTTIDLQDLCGNQLTFSHGDLTISPEIQVTGSVRYYFANTPVNDATVTLTGSTELSDITNLSGVYRFGNVQAGNYTISPTKSADHRGAIRGSDALLLLRHLAFLESLTTDQLICADVTSGGSVSGADAVAILNFLAFSSNIRSTGQWKFSPASAVLSVPSDTVQDFKAYLLGDITGDWGSAILAKPNHRNEVLQITEAKMPKGESAQVSILLSSVVEPVNTIAFSVEFDSSLVDLASVELAGPLTDYTVAVNDQERGRLHFAGAGLQSISADCKLMDLKFESKRPAAETKPYDFIAVRFSRIELNDQPAKWIDGGIEVLAGANREIPENFQLQQNYPNPFNAGTSIKYGIPGLEKNGSHVLLDIYNVNGQRIRRLVDSEGQPGFYTVQWDAKDDHGNIVSTGIYFYRLKAGNIAISRKLLLIK